MQSELTEIIESLPEMEKNLVGVRDTLLSNLVMIGEIPAPTFSEQNRMNFFIERLTQENLLNCSTDEMGNGIGILPGETGKRNILLVAHLDSLFEDKVDHTISIHPNKVTGPGVGDNSLGLACIVSLPSILRTMNISFDSNLLLMGASRSLGRGDTEGLRFFLENSDMPIHTGLIVEGVQLGRISYSSIGMMRYEISYRVPEEYDWTRFGASGSIVNINELINRILEISLPSRPKTSIILGSIGGGRSFHSVANETFLRFEIRSDSGDMVNKLGRQIQDIASELASQSGSEVGIQVLASRKPGGITYAHPLAESARTIMQSLNITPRITPSTSELSAFIDENIPALTLALTNGEYMNKQHETIEIGPVYKGLAQFIGLLLAIDKGYCDESE